jgi:hypothetical protein
MNKIRLFFLLLLSAVSIICLYLAGTFHQSPPGEKKDKISEFKITKISGNGKVYFDEKPIDSEHPASSSAKAVDITRMEYREAAYFRSESHTSFEFFCFGTRFIVLPDSYFHYRPKTGAFLFHEGEFYWKKEQKSKKMEMSLREAGNLLTLSNEGRARVGPDTIRVWNYDGNSIFNYNEEDHTINKRQLLIAVKAPPARTRRPRPPRPPDIINLLPAPASIDPLEKTISLTNPEASIQRFDWRVVRGKPGYVFRLYSSDLKENLLVERTVQTTNVTLDMLQFDERDFYWEVTPVDGRTQQEGVPSQPGHINVIGALLVKKNVQKPPELNVRSLTVNGNLVIIKGEADTNARLYINDDVINVDRDGSFIHYITYKEIGPKKIIIRLVSPLGVETVDERNITVFAE